MKVRRLFLAVLVPMALAAGCCSMPSPTGPAWTKGFFETVRDLATGEEVSAWLNTNTVAAAPDTSYLKYDGDFIYQQARALFENRRGACSNYASFFAFWARNHSYRCGTLFTVYLNGMAHDRAWIVEEDGSVSTTNNAAFARSRFADFETFVEWTIANERGEHAWRDEAGTLLRTGGEI